MIRTAPATAHAAYTQELAAAVGSAERIAGLPQLPTRLMTLNATFYLDGYLPGSVYRAALDTALSAATEERHSWRNLPSGVVPASAELERQVQAGATRPALYRWLFEQALATGQPQRLVLAQHACEIAEVLDDRYLLRALRFGLLALPDVPEQVADPLLVPPLALLIEGVSRALLDRRITAAQFVAHLLALHAANRARELTDPSFTAPLALAAGAIVPLLAGDAMQHAPKRLRVAQSCELALRAVHDVDHPGPRWGVLAVEAGLVEAESLSSGQHLLLLAALDRLLPGECGAQ